MAIPPSGPRFFQYSCERPTVVRGYGSASKPFKWIHPLPSYIHKAVSNGRHDSTKRGKHRKRTTDALSVETSTPRTIPINNAARLGLNTIPTMPPPYSGRR